MATVFFSVEDWPSCLTLEKSGRAKGRNGELWNFGGYQFSSQLYQESPRIVSIMLTLLLKKVLLVHQLIEFNDCKHDHPPTHQPGFTNLGLTLLKLIDFVVQFLTHNYPDFEDVILREKPEENVLMMDSARSDGGLCKAHFKAGLFKTFVDGDSDSINPYIYNY